MSKAFDNINTENIVKLEINVKDNLLAAVTFNGKVSIFDFDKLEPIFKFSIKENVKYAKFNKISSQLIVAGEKTLQVFNQNYKEQLKKIKLGVLVNCIDQHPTRKELSVGT